VYPRVASASAVRAQTPGVWRREVCERRTRRDMLLHRWTQRRRGMGDGLYAEPPLSSVTTLDLASVVELHNEPGRLSAALRPVLERQLTHWGLTVLSTQPPSTDDHPPESDDGDAAQEPESEDRPASLFDILLMRVCRDMFGSETFTGSIDAWRPQAAGQFETFLHNRMLLIAARFCSVPHRREVIGFAAFDRLIALLREESHAGCISDDERDELELVARAHAGDDQALLELYRKVKDRLVKFLGARFRLSPDPTGDVLQDTYLRLMRSMSRFDPSLSTFLASARWHARRAAIGHMKKVGWGPELPPDDGPGDGDRHSTGPDAVFVSTALLKRAFTPQMPLHLKLAFAFKVFLDYQPRHIVGELSGQTFPALIEKLRSDPPRTAAYGAWQRTLASLLEQHLEREPALRRMAFEHFYTGDVKTAKTRSADVSRWLHEVKTSTVVAVAALTAPGRKEGK
jgi:hypothetical protein